MHVHLARAVDDPLFSDFARSLPAGVTTSHGDDAPPETEVLVMGFPSPDVLGSLSHLKTVVIPFAGLVPTAREALLGRPDLAVYNLHHNAAATAEKAIELLLAATKDTLHHDQAMRESGWAPRFEQCNALELDGRKALVVGFGEIGKRVAAVLAAMGMQVSVFRRNGQMSPYPTFPASELLSKAPTADVLLVCAPLTPETAGLVSREVINGLPTSAVVVNVGRGAIIDEGALYEALKERRIHGAGLDVWWHYPKQGETCDPSIFDFASLPNVVMSPHCGGTVLDTEPKRLGALSVLVTKLHQGTGLPAQVDVVAGY
ncbi:MAG: hypothetical protein JSS66_15020 [Armatimonadetes bacterium]|nr:hypothetical protein [Armatimonadota bacterium]